MHDSALKWIFIVLAIVCIWIVYILSYKNSVVPDIAWPKYAAGYNNETTQAIWQHERNQSRTVGREHCGNEVRLEAIREACKNIEYKKPTSTKDLQKLVKGLYVDDVNHVMFCLHAKVGTCTWKTILANNSVEKPIRDEDFQKPTSQFHKYNIKKLKKYSIDEIKYRLEKYFKVMVVRHPYDRLESGWYGKFKVSCHYCKKMGQKMLRQYHPELPEDVLIAGRATQFEDFIQWIQDGHNNQHWRAPYHSLCNPCAIHYDYIIKLETFNTDAPHVVDNYMKGRLGTSRNMHRIKTGSLLDGHEMKFFANLSDEQLLFLEQRHKDDLEMFGYTFDKTTLRASCNYDSTDNACC